MTAESCDAEAADEYPYDEVWRRELCSESVSVIRAAVVLRRDRALDLVVDSSGPLTVTRDEAVWLVSMLTEALAVPAPAEAA